MRPLPSVANVVTDGHNSRQTPRAVGQRFGCECTFVRIVNACQVVFGAFDGGAGLTLSGVGGA